MLCVDLEFGDCRLDFAGNLGKVRCLDKRQVCVKGTVRDVASSYVSR